MSGNQFYKYRWQVLYLGEHLATMLTHTKNEKFVRKGVVKVDFKNHLLYTGMLWQFYDELTGSLNLQFKNVSRVDIAIDGLDHIIRFVNKYLKQTRQNKVVELVGRGTIRAAALDRNTMLYHSFKLGANGSRKQVTIYNKTKEIIKSQKDYIQKFWKANGIHFEELPLAEMLAALKKGEDEPMNVAGVKNIFRFELRLTGEYIQEMQVKKAETGEWEFFKIDWLKTSDGMMSIVHRACENFFEFVLKTYKENCKCKRLELIPFSKFEIFPIELQPVKRADDLYKTKLSIKKNVRQLFFGVLQPSDYMATEALVFDVNNYDLKEWFAKNLFTWFKELEYSNPDADYVQTVKDFLIDINQRFESNQEHEILI